MHGASKVASSVLQEITEAVINNPSPLPTDVSKGKGLNFVPSAVDSASAHLSQLNCYKCKRAIPIYICTPVSDPLKSLKK